jgi:hypothetical protein
MIKRIFVSVCLWYSCALTGCTFFGYYKHERAPQAPPEEAAAVELPDSFESGTHLSGPMMAALKVAMGEFMPPGKKVKTDDGDERLARCLSRWETFDTSVLQAGDNLYFVRFSPKLSRCGLQELILDAGAVYAIDGSGRVLDVR